MTHAKKNFNRENVELDYRAGIKTLRQIADENGISAPAIAQMAKRYGWTRDLSAKIREKAEAKVNAAVVNKQVNKKRAVNEKEVIEANASCSAAVVLREREDIQRAVSVTSALMRELESQAGAENAELLARLGEILASGDAEKMDAAYQKIISLPERSKTLKSLADSLKVLVELERKVLRIDGKDNEDAEIASKQLSDVERAVRLARALSASPELSVALRAKVGA